ncbi:MAG: 30S ribosomal protein S9 [Candidatus Diapherotrites archaeon]|nr:30S ribosomal protein S9 [Candidatus Diapherotrites archaeon]
MHIKSKRKESVARAVVRKGTGRIRINHRPIGMIQPAALRTVVEDAIEMTGENAHKVNMDIHVKGGGSISQAIAARSAIAKGIVEFSGDDELRKKLLAYDRLLLVDDPRRVEPKKPLGPKARRKKQKSKR